ncbi:MAG: hypothetical protein A2X17_01765 [Bacteroidetes bacterium GWF2_41_61]|nr:MAG: hypothetical protein A2X17_01765 [Bacteroidetes bacterium GWF2_41_61]HBG25239.1 hypothetical protein [Rikenellaceae bacterium]
MIKTYSFPSVYESTLRDFSTSNDPILGFSKLKFDGANYLVGLQALNEGVSPHKSINASPEDVDYKIITQSALLLASNALKGESKNGKVPKMVVTSGFPYATYQFNKDNAIEYYKEEKIITYYKADDNGSLSSEQRVVSVASANVIPELVGCDIAVRKGDQPVDGNFIIISLGYGTCEGAVSTPEGLTTRSFFSTHGISYPVNVFSQEISKHTYLKLRTEHQIDHLFSKGFMFVERKRKDFTEEKKLAISMYYNNVISPTIRRYITDEDFENCQKMILVGGGALHKDLVEMFNEEFGEICNISIFNAPEKCASIGYALYSKASVENKEGDGFSYTPDSEEKVVYVGIDIGNANTCVSVISNSF